MLHALLEKFMDNSQSRYETKLISDMQEKLKEIREKKLKELGEKKRERTFGCPTRSKVIGHFLWDFWKC